MNMAVNWQKETQKIEYLTICYNQKGMDQLE